MQSFQPVDDFLFGIIANRTRIDENSISVFNLVSHCIPIHFHDGSDYFAVCHIHLTPVGFDEQLLFFRYGCGF